jgi:hypothetical protein
MSNQISELQHVRIEFNGSGVKELLDEVSEMLDFDVDFESLLPDELRQRLLDFLEAPAKLFTIGSKRSVAGGACECWVSLKPSDSFLDFVLALRAWNRNRSVTV